jgi:hypothetical protein
LKKNSKKRKRGYRYIISDEQLLSFSKLDYNQRLDWFFAFHDFLRKFQPESSRIIMNKFRAGEI